MTEQELHELPLDEVLKRWDAVCADLHPRCGKRVRRDEVEWDIYKDSHSMTIRGRRKKEDD